jgi:ABC-type Fe3+-hydroxamate transport system substrate-binding protein
MKKFSIITLTLMLALSFAACGSKEQVKDTAATKTVEKVVEKKAEPKADPKVVCAADCDKTAEACVTKAAKDKKAAAKCDAAKKKCTADCDKTKVVEPAKKK